MRLYLVRRFNTGCAAAKQLQLMTSNFVEFSISRDCGVSNACLPKNRKEEAFLIIFGS
jgi:hypothetical protein